jgi:hypothetical protein
MKTTPSEETAHIYLLALELLAKIAWLDLEQFAALQARFEGEARGADPADKFALLALAKMCRLYEAEAKAFHADDGEGYTGAFSRHGRAQAEGEAGK